MERIYLAITLKHESPQLLSRIKVNLVCFFGGLHCKLINEFNCALHLSSVSSLKLVRNQISRNAPYSIQCKTCITQHGALQKHDCVIGSHRFCCYSNRHCSQPYC
jgi:hypothetical protein